MTRPFKPIKLGSLNENNSSQSSDAAELTSKSAEDSKTSTKTQLPVPLRWERGRWRTWSFRRKAVALALAIGVLPVAAVGGIAYTIASGSMTAQITAEQENQLLSIRNGISIVINQFVKDAKTIAQSPLLTDSQLNTKASLVQKTALLNNLIETSSKYSHIAVFNLEGRLLFQSNSSTPLPGSENYSKQQHFQQAIATQLPVISDPKGIPSSKGIYLEVAVPIKQSETGKLLGIVMMQMPSKQLDGLFDYVQSNIWEYQLVDADGQIFASNHSDSIGQPMASNLEGLTSIWAEVLKKNLILTQLVTDKNDRDKVLVSLTTITDLEGIPNSGWGLSIYRPIAQAFAPLHQLRQIFLIGICSAGLLVGAIATILATRATRPLLAATHTVKKLAQGDWRARLKVQGKDELAILCSTINHMAEHLETFVEQRSLLHRRVHELLLEVEPVGKGDLTVHARVTDDEAGTIANSYNSTIESLRRLVLQVQSATNQVEAIAYTNENLVQELTEGALQQSEKITIATQRIQTMADSIHRMVANAEAAEVVVQQATQTIQAGNELMNSTVDGIVAIRETVAGTAKKVKHLGEASQEISTVVNLIKSFSQQTNLLALNASIEATRAEEEDLGFAIVAEEIQDLAQKSARATTEIEKLVFSIQQATTEVVTAMETGISQVVSGTQLVNQTRLGLDQIVTANAQIHQVVDSLAQAAVEQTQISEIMTQTMEEVAAIADNTVTSTMDVSASFKELLAVAKMLQGSVSKFKV